ncbi:hypothetical protein BJ741DRAFT_620136 [Chytriomyces cf. hyalinus JEL632]|nr:hypothetical protein BJ741DRAFT_620136 [Chytriomyces cf. hyalinus JEL632]
MHPSTLPFEPGTITPAIFVPLYTAFLHAYHAQTHVHSDDPAPVKCKIQDHLTRFDQPPTFEGRTFSTYEFLGIVMSQGGFQNIRSWTDLCRRVGMNPSKSNISTRIREWAEKHHIVPFFDYILGHSNPYFRDLRSDEMVGCIRVEKDEGNIPETESEMWLRLYGLDGGLTTKRKKPLVVPVSTPSSSDLYNMSLSKRSLDTANDDSNQNGTAKKPKVTKEHVVLVAGVPMAALSVSEQQVLNEVSACLQQYAAAENSAVLASVPDTHVDSTAISTMNLVPAPGGSVLVPSAADRIASLHSGMDRLRALQQEIGAVKSDTAPLKSENASGANASPERAPEASNVSLGEHDLKSQNGLLEGQVARLVEMLKAQGAVLENLRKRIVSDD